MYNEFAERDRKKKLGQRWTATRRCVTTFSHVFLFVCQHCGTKYSVEEAKKMMIEGTVKIDNTDKLNNLYHLARRAKLENNEKNACKYYEMILLEDPTSWEASFYAVYFSAINFICKDAEDYVGCLKWLADISYSWCNPGQTPREYGKEHKELVYWAGGVFHRMVEASRNGSAA